MFNPEIGFSRPKKRSFSNLRNLTASAMLLTAIGLRVPLPVTNAQEQEVSVVNFRFRCLDNGQYRGELNIENPQYLPPYQRYGLRIIEQDTERVVGLTLEQIQQPLMIDNFNQTPNQNVRVQILGGSVNAIIDGVTPQMSLTTPDCSQLPKPSSQGIAA
jgi:hypothetical protein